MIQRLTEAEVREKYLKEVEQKNRTLDEKNRELQNLYDELKNTEAQLIQSEKMASLGQLVAGIAHELNNPIAFIYGNAKHLNRYVSRIEKFVSAGQNEKDHQSLQTMLPDLKSLIEDTIRGSHTVKELVQNLRTFSHLDQAEKKPADIHEGLETCLMIVHPQIKGRIKVVKNYEAEGVIECNIGQLNQVFLNLLLNASQAIEGEGEIHVTTKNEDEEIVISISDTGSGIPESIRSRIFDPFFTTKEVGQGMGLGLSISYSIVEKHQGKIAVESEAGKGSTFCIRLPL
jgi:signal transduction histidine kinase